MSVSLTRFGFPLQSIGLRQQYYHRGGPDSQPDQPHLMVAGGEAGRGLCSEMGGVLVTGYHINLTVN